MTTISEPIYANKPSKDIPLEIEPVGGRIGVIVQGVKLSADIDDATVDAIHSALARHKVLFFRDQTHLDDAEQEAFAARLGEPIVHPTVPAAGGSKTILELNSDHGAFANSWHTDVTFVENPPLASILRGVIIPRAGGDTIWANGETAYQDLSDELRLIADQLWAVHTNAFDYANVRRQNTNGQEESYKNTFASTIYESEHPLVRVHPVTGERSLLLGHFFKNFSGLSKPESQRLYDIFQSYITRPENTVRWRWRAGDVAIWDNRATQHYAVADYGTQKRIVRRVTLKGDAPFGIDGRRSRLLKKEPQPQLQAAE